MVKIIENVPLKRSRMIKVPGEKPSLSGRPGQETIGYDGIVVPKGLNRRLLKKCGVGIKREEDGLSKREVSDKMYETTSDKNLYMRFAGSKPMSVVTDEFKPFSPRRLYSESKKIIGTEPTIRYFEGNESLQFNFPIDSRFEGMNLVVNTGDYGVFAGGTGECRRMSYALAI